MHACGLENPAHESGRRPLSQSCIQDPKGLDFDSDGNLYVTDGPRLWKVYLSEGQGIISENSEAEILFSAEDAEYPLNSVECLSDVDIAGDKARLIDECSGIMFELNISNE